jgi:DNA-binding NarL/FixJ family response regulator
MQPSPDVIIAGSEHFCNRVYDFIDDIIPEVHQISYAPRAETLFQEIKEKQYHLLLVEEVIIKRPAVSVCLGEIKTTAPSLKIILVASGNQKKEIKEADYVLPAKFSKKDLAAILLEDTAPVDPRKEASLKLIREALKDGFHIRHLQVFNGLVSNQSARIIGENICLGTRTIETYREQLYQVAGAKGVALITLFGLKRGWIDIDGNKFLDDEILNDFILEKIR